jgi:hypothetical protein
VIEPSKINYVVYSRIASLSEFKTRFSRIKKIVTNWKQVAIFSIGLFTVKVMAEQLLLLVR